MSYNDTELTLGLPGCQSRGYSSRTSTSANSTSMESSTSKDQVVIGWSPVRSTRIKTLDAKNLKSISSRSSRYVKVGADGAPYLRKVDLEMYTCYEELLTALEKIFTIKGKYMKHAVVRGMVEYDQYVLTYEDTDDDWMLVGDVPWKMFKESCKRIRLMKNSES